MAIGTAYIKIMPEAKGIESTIGGVVDPAAEKAGKSSGNKYIGALKKVVAGAAIGKWIGSSILAGADLEQSIGGIETLYKGASDKMMQYASQAYKTAGVDANTYMEQVTSYSAGLIASMGGDVDAAADVANQAMIDMADNANKLGTPMESIQNAYQGFAKQNYTMLDNLKLGYGGTKTEMERLLADAEKITGVKYDISNLDDVYNAIHVIQTEMGITGTTQKEASETIAGSINMVKASYKDLIANLALGADIYPQLEALGTSLVAMFKNVLPAIGSVVIGIPKAIIQHFPEIVNAVRQGINTAVSHVMTSTPQWYNAIANLVRNAVNYFIKMFPTWRNAIITTITNLASTLLQNAPLIIDKIKTIATNALTLLAHYAPQFIQAAFTIVKNLGVMLITNLPSILRSVFNLAMSIIKGGLNLAWNAVKSAVSGIISTVGALGSAVVSRIKSGLASVGNAIIQPFQNAWNKLKGVINKIKSIFPLRLGKIFDGIKLPHFKISGGKIPWGIGGAGKKPSISVEWYAQGGIMAKPTLFGGGEAGAEAIMPLDPFWARMDKLVDGVNNMGGVTINVYGGTQSANDIAEAVERKIIEMQNRRRLAWQ